MIGVLLCRLLVASTWASKTPTKKSRRRLHSNLKKTPPIGKIKEEEDEYSPILDSFAPILLCQSMSSFFLVALFAPWHYPSRPRQSCKTFNESILITQRIKACTLYDSQHLDKVIFQHNYPLQLLYDQRPQFNNVVKINVLEYPRTILGLENSRLS